MERFDNKPWAVWLPKVQKETALSVCKKVSFVIGLLEELKRFALEVYEVKDTIWVEKVHSQNCYDNVNKYIDHHSHEVLGVLICSILSKLQVQKK